jgi:hypothetical protein
MDALRQWAPHPVRRLFTRRFGHCSGTKSSGIETSYSRRSVSELMVKGRIRIGTIPLGPPADQRLSSLPVRRLFVYVYDVALLVPACLAVIMNLQVVGVVVSGGNVDPAVFSRAVGL